MRNFKYIVIFLLILIFRETKSEQNNLVFHGAYAFETFPGQKTSAAYMSIFNNTDQDFTLKSVSSDIADKVEIHGVLIENEVVRMKKVNELIIKSKDQVYFQPGGMHIMLMGLKKDISDGSSFYINFLVNDRNQQVKVLVLNKKLRENFIE